jgi:hypothetical protein
MIESTVASLLYCTDAKGLDLVSDLAMSDLVDELNIVTLNHDTLVEQVLAANGIDFSDGFGGPDGDVRWFEGGRSKVAQWELACNPWEDHDLIFPRETSGKPMRYTSLNNAYRQICMEAGVEYRSFHILRHTCASLLLSQGESIKLVQKQLRHRDVKVTLSTYTHLLPEAGPEALKKLIPRSWASNELSNEWGPNRSTRVHNHLHR